MSVWPEVEEMGCAKAVEKEEMRKRMIVEIRKKNLNMVVPVVLLCVQVFGVFRYDEKERERKCTKRELVKSFKTR